jgi:hypothetical protein
MADVCINLQALQMEYFSNKPYPAGRICHLENVKCYMSYLQQYTKIIKKLTLKTYFS